MSSVFAETAFTFICITPGKDPMRCSMDWTQEPQVIPSTPRDTEHRLTFCVMIAFSERTQEGQQLLSNIKLQGLNIETGTSCPYLKRQIDLLLPFLDLWIKEVKKQRTKLGIISN